MVNVTVTVETSSVTAIVESLQLKLQPSNLKEFLIAHAHRELRERAEARFASEGDNVSGAWAQLTFATSRIRSFQGFPPFHPINVRSGQLKSWVLSSFLVEAMGEGAVLTMPGVASGNIMAKFKMAQQGGGGGTRSSRPATNATRAGSRLPGEGSSGPNRTTPARPVVGMDVSDALIISHEFLDWIRQGIF